MSAAPGAWLMERISSLTLPSRAVQIDQALLYSFILLVVFGIVMMGSASMEYAGQHFNDPWYHIKRQSLFLALGLLIALFTVYIPIEFWRKHSAQFLLFAFLLLLAVLLPGVGKEVNGSQRWIPIGVFNLQASEPAKLFVIVYMAAYLVRREREVRNEWRGFIKPLLVLSAMISLLLLEPDFGAVVVMLGASLGMLFLAGVRLVHFSFVVVGSLFAIALMALMSPYRLQRLITFMDPWPHQFDSGYQLVQSLIAFGRGEWLGLGLGRSVQKLFYLPEAHTDFVFAIIGEEFGFIGALMVVCLFGVFIWRILIIARGAERRGFKFAAYFCYGIALLFAIQSFINIGVNTGLLPTKGLTLPFFSYGGSSLVLSCLMVACVLRANYETGTSCAKPL
ncbi:MAG: putative lipid II flippase FtsW [Pseudomonadales bacterium]